MGRMVPALASSFALRATEDKSLQAGLFSDALIGMTEAVLRVNWFST